MHEPAALVIDVGGTKTLAALVRGPEVLAEARVPTAPGRGAEAWIGAAAAVAAPWAGRYDRVAAAVTGVVDDGRWSALNPATLDVEDGFPLVERLEATFGRPALALNDAQAAAWGEHRFGAGQGADIVFVTLSTGLGGGIVLSGRLRQGRGGLAGHLGVQSPLRRSKEGACVEDAIAGRWIVAEAARAGFWADAQAVFAAAAAGERWAETILGISAERTARLLGNVQLVLAPDLVVLGGSIGLAPGHLDRIDALLAPLPARRRPRLVPAALGARAGVVGAADLAATASAAPNRRTLACTD